MRVLIVVTHLLGAGHLTRAAALARAFARAGHATTLVSGGTPVPLADFEDVSLVQLPPVRTTGTDFKALLDEAGAPIDATRLDRRRELLLATLQEARPDVVVTELFPFGRRVLADEFMALLEAARSLQPRPLVLSSIRDILVAPSKPERVAEAHGRIAAFYDAVLVHGDPRIVPLTASWPVDPELAPLLHYTGYVDEGSAPARNLARNGIVVSGGSSAASLPLYRAAVEASRMVADRPWRILIGRGVAEADFRSLQAMAPPHATVERARRDFRDLLAQAEVSVSQAGYNTVVDLLQAGVTPVLVPFEAGHETEQRLRAERLKSLGFAEIVPEAGLSAPLLADAVRQALAGPSSPPPTLSLDGARESVTIAETLSVARPALNRSIDWSPIGQALSRARDAGRGIGFWWRDDDAVAHTPELDRLLGLARRYEAGIGLAAIPALVEASLAHRLRDEDGALALVHGWSHANHAPPGQKKAEFGDHRPTATLAAEAGDALRMARAALGQKVLPVFVPPWNRIAPGLVPHLPGLGYRALSTFRDRDRHQPVRDLVQINTHIDPIDWHGSRSLVEPAALVASVAAAIDRRVDGTADADEPIGFLTHHKVHDESIWFFCEGLAAYLADREVRFLRINRLFRNESRIAVEQ
ncbi:glycosyltransferase [Microvirga lenta]|uniref:glycosyltransferase n=1 Tax=Microvirga lenta TaxID=2881337 RepID=UPI001CFFFC18|nr:glycosyltransferase [Microvirga lenta]MCB5176377.1 glycosyl transferase family 28 [Microvirga lenta]